MSKPIEAESGFESYLADAAACGLASAILMLLSVVSAATSLTGQNPVVIQVEVIATYPDNSEGSIEFIHNEEQIGKMRVENRQILFSAQEGFSDSQAEHNVALGGVIMKGRPVTRGLQTVTVSDDKWSESNQLLRQMRINLLITASSRQQTQTVSLKSTFTTVDVTLSLANPKGSRGSSKTFTLGSDRSNGFLFSDQQIEVLSEIQ